MTEAGDIGEVTIVKIDTGGGERSSSGKISKKEKIGLGLEGEKWFVDLSINREDRERNAGSFVTKKLFKNELEETISKVNELKTAGIPLPPTVRYFEEDGEYFLLLTDLTEGGKNLVWSVNNNMGEIANFHFEEDGLADLKKQLLEIAEKADEAGYSLPKDSYFVVQAPGEKPKIIVGDFGLSINKKAENPDPDSHFGRFSADQREESYKKGNEREAMRFLSDLSGKFEPFLSLGEEIDSRMVAQIQIAGEPVEIGRVDNRLIFDKVWRRDMLGGIYSDKEGFRLTPGRSGTFTAGERPLRVFETLWLNNGDVFSIGEENYSVDIRGNVLSLLKIP